MSTKGNSYGQIHRYEPAGESVVAAIAIVVLTILEVVMVGLFTWGLVEAWGVTQAGNVYLGTLLGLMFINLGVILALYRKEFLPDVMIVKKRRRKWEDVSIAEEDVDGETVLDDLVVNVKYAIYPHYKR